ncbi:MAG: hypothetical protein ACLGH0_06720 [Thermoanaerobaculia bacterium]
MLRTRLTLKPGTPGTKKLLAEYGSRLIAVRYRYDDERQTRCKTIEIVIEEIPWSPETAAVRISYAPNEPVEIRTDPTERPLIQALRARNARWNEYDETWTLPYADALALRLTDRIINPRPARPLPPPTRPARGNP